MCGIAGYVSAEGPASGELARRMCDAIRHRGPDGDGVWLDGPVALGHRRLSIIDVSGGAQPLGNEDGRVQIVFNGEIYNYLELREELLAKGHRFSTHSDTEVLVHLYEEEGERMAERLNGMFAFAIWDLQRREMLLARDRFGKKPLYYSTTQPGFRLCFASEIKALAALPDFDVSARAESVADYLALGYVPDPDTIYQKVNKLAPAHTLLFRDGVARLRRYWTPTMAPEPEMSFSDARARLVELAADAVERRLMSEVPLGGFLSGGVDSSAVVALMAERSPHRVKSFSIGFSERSFDETRYARLVAERYATEHHEETVTPSIGEMLRVLVEHYDEPFADSSAIPTLYLARMTRKYVTVALSGDGADEIFGGYRRYRFAVAEERARGYLPGWFRHTAVGWMAGIYPKLDWAPRFLRAKATLSGISQELGSAYFTAMSRFGYGLEQRVRAARFTTALGGYSAREAFAARFEKYRHLAPLEQLQAVDFETYLPGDILVKADRATMAYSLEGRAPWLDYRLAELAGRMPAAFKLSAGTGKHIFREALRPLLPEPILARPKMGFSVPLATWFRTSLKPVVERLLFDPGRQEWLDGAVVRRIFETHLSGRRDYSRELWSMLLLACWFERHGGGDRARLDELFIAA